MALIDMIFTSNTALGILLGILFWGTAKAIDKILERFIHQKLFSRIWYWGKKRWKILLTRYKPIRTTFRFSYGIDDEIGMNTVRDRIEPVLKNVERFSEQRVEFEDLRTDESGQVVSIDAYYSERENPYEIEFELVPDPSSIRDGDARFSDEANVDSIGISVDFDFSFHSLESAFINVSAFVRFLEKAVGEEFAGRSSAGQIVISPVDTDLSLDEWIEKRQFDVSVLLESEESKTAVEFFGDRAVIDSPYLEIDSDTTDYVRATLLNYYL